MTIDYVKNKTLTIYYCWHNYTLGKSGVAGFTDIHNFDITDGGPATKITLL